MNLHHLYYFCKVAELEHYKKASEELYISQPSLSGAMAALEKELGISLFQKDGRNIQLTKYGKVFYQYVSEALKILDEGVNEIKEFSGEASGTVDIGCISTIMGSFLPAVMEEFKHIYPDIKINVFLGQTNDIIQGIESGKFDVGFCTHDRNRPELSFIPVLFQTVVAVMCKNHPFANKESISLDELRNEKLISYSLSQPIGQQIKLLLDPKMVSADFSYCSEVMMGGIINQEKISEDTTGRIALMIYSPELQAFDNISVVPLDDVPKHYHSVNMVFDTNSDKIHAVKKFIDFVAAKCSYKFGN